MLHLQNCQIQFEKILQKLHTLEYQIGVHVFLFIFGKKIHL